MNSIGKTYTQAYNLNTTSALEFGLTARMLSPDPFVQNASSTQNFNRYSYCMNNPLKYTDPSGYYYMPDGTWIEGGIDDDKYIHYQAYSEVLKIANENSENSDGSNNLPKSAWQGVCDAANGVAFLEITDDGIKISYKSKYAENYNEDGRIIKPFFVKDERIAMQIIWESSFKDGKPLCETAMYKVIYGYLILPNIKNDLKKCETYSYLITKENSFYVVAFVHTHPEYNLSDIGISGKDEIFNMSYKTFTIYNENLYDINETYIYNIYDKN